MISVCPVRCRAAGLCFLQPAARKHSPPPPTPLSPRALSALDADASGQVLARPLPVVAAAGSMGPAIFQAKGVSRASD